MVSRTISSRVFRWISSNSSISRLPRNRCVFLILKLNFCKKGNPFMPSSFRGKELEMMWKVCFYPRKLCLFVLVICMFKCASCEFFISKYYKTQLGVTCHCLIKFISAPMSMSRFPRAVIPSNLDMMFWSTFGLVCTQVSSSPVFVQDFFCQNCA